MKDVMYHYIDKEDYNAGFDVSKALSQADVIPDYYRPQGCKF